MNAGLQIKGVSYHYGSISALSDISFTVGPGRFCALLGPNGAGKSTLFNLLTQLLMPAKGQIIVAGHDLATAPRRALAAMGVVFQQPTFDPELSVRRNLLFFAALHGLAGREAGLRIDAALDRLAMRERAGERARDLNGGHRRRMEIARALIHRPQFLLLDEPTVGLDAASRRSVTDHVHALAQDGMTVLWATHLTDEVTPDDQLVILHQGRVLADGTARDIAGPAGLTQTFLALTGAAA